MRDIPDLSEREQDMIRRHMFPLNPVPPRYRESWILCAADKICSTGETVDGIAGRMAQMLVRMQPLLHAVFYKNTDT